MNERVSTSIMAVNHRISMDGKQRDQTSEDCIICCEKVTDKSYVSDCLHYFCYKCIKQWIEVRAVCPLCVQPISSIIYNVRSADDYDIQTVQPPAYDVLSNWNNDIELWASSDENDFNDMSDISSDETAPAISSANSLTESDEDPAMDDNSGDDSDCENTSANDLSLSSNGTDNEVFSLSDIEDTNSHLTSNSDMEEDEWHVSITDYENDTENEDYNNYSGNDSEVDEDDLDYSYDNLCDSDSPAYNSDEYDESAGSEYHTGGDESGHDYSEDSDCY